MQAVLEELATPTASSIPRPERLHPQRHKIIVRGAPSKGLALNPVVCSRGVTNMSVKSSPSLEQRKPPRKSIFWAAQLTQGRLNVALDAVQRWA
jgi:hypothetical protein